MEQRGIFREMEQVRGIVKELRDIRTIDLVRSGLGFFIPRTARTAIGLGISGLILALSLPILHTTPSLCTSLSSRPFLSGTFPNWFFKFGKFMLPLDFSKFLKNLSLCALVYYAYRSSLTVVKYDNERTKGILSPDNKADALGEGLPPRARLSTRAIDMGMNLYGYGLYTRGPAAEVKGIQKGNICQNNIVVMGLPKDATYNTKLGPELMEAIKNHLYLPRMLTSNKLTEVDRKALESRFLQFHIFDSITASPKALEGPLKFVLSKLFVFDPITTKVYLCVVHPTKSKQNGKDIFNDFGYPMGYIKKKEPSYCAVARVTLQKTGINVHDLTCSSPENINLPVDMLMQLTNRYIVNQSGALGKMYTSIIVLPLSSHSTYFNSDFLAGPSASGLTDSKPKGIVPFDPALGGFYGVYYSKDYYVAFVPIENVNEYNRVLTNEYAEKYVSLAE